MKCVFFVEKKYFPVLRCVDLTQCKSKIGLAPAVSFALWFFLPGLRMNCCVCGGTRRLCRSGGQRCDSIGIVKTALGGRINGFIYAQCPSARMKGAGIGGVKTPSKEVAIGADPKALAVAAFECEPTGVAEAILPGKANRRCNGGHVRWIGCVPTHRVEIFRQDPAHAETGKGGGRRGGGRGIRFQHLFHQHIARGIERIA
jgi:hypothetical protein